MYRVEDKYALSMRDMYILRTRINAILQPDSNDSNLYGYKISSLYFDDIHDTHLIDTINGNPFRKKYRVRIYNDSFDLIKLEVKNKQYNRIKKVSATITKEQLDSLINGETIDSKSNDMDNPINMFNIEMKSRLLRPKVIVTYERKAYVSEVGNVRITFDTNLRGSNHIQLYGKKDLQYDSIKGQDSVLEVKYDEFLPDYIAQTLEINRMWQTAFSKYRLCRELY